MEAWRLQRVQERAEIAAELRGDLSAEEEAKLLRSIESRERANEALHLANLTKSQKAADYEEVLDQLKLAAGATSLEEVVEKLFAQGTTTTSLEKEKAQAEARLIAVRQQKEQALQILNELKASGIGGIELNREVYNTLENEIQQSKATLKVNKAGYERLDGVITGVRQGSFGLAQRLQAFDDVLDVTSLENCSSLLSSSTSGIPGGARGEHADCLAIAELKLTKMLELVGQQNSSVNSFSGFGGSGGNGNENEETYEDGSSRADLDDRNAPWSPTMNSDPVLHRNNIRVRPGVPFSRQLQFNREDSLDSARSNSSTVSDSGSDHIDVLVPSRDILKMSSSRHFSEVMRKKEVGLAVHHLSSSSSYRCVNAVVVGSVVGGEAESGGGEGHLGRGDDVEAAETQPARCRHAVVDLSDALEHTHDEPQRQRRQVLRLRDAAEFQRPVMKKRRQISSKHMQTDRQLTEEFIDHFSFSPKHYH